MGLCMKRRAWLGLAVAIAFAPAAAFAQDGLVIFAAASLKNALDEIATGWKDSGKPAAKISYAASSALAKQLEQGAPADMGLLSAGHKATIDRYVGYYEPYAENHQALDADRAFQEEARNAARALVKAVKLLRKGEFPQPDAGLTEPRPK